MQWFFDPNLPIYTQIVEQIRLFIVSGIMKAGERMPSVRDLASEAGVNPNTMQRALAELERTGLIYASRTNGRFVTDQQEVIDVAKAELATDSVARFIQEMTRLGFTREEMIAMIEKEKEIES